MNSLRKLHSFFWMGPLFAIILLSIMTFISMPQFTIGFFLQVGTGIALMFSAVAFIFLPIKEMIEKEPYVNMADFNEKSKSARNEFILPLIAYMGFQFIFVATITDAPMLRALYYSIGITMFISIFFVKFITKSISSIFKRKPEVSTVHA